MTSARVVPFNPSSAAVPTIVHSALAPATLLSTPCANAGPTSGQPSPRKRRSIEASWMPLSELAAGDGVAGVDDAGVHVGPTIDRVVAGDVVLRLQEVVSALADERV